MAGRRLAASSDKAARSVSAIDRPACASPGCATVATTMCALCGRVYCGEHCRRASLFTIFRSRTDWPEDLMDLLNSLDDPRARIWMCIPCEAGAPIPGGSSWAGAGGDPRAHDWHDM